MLVLLAIGMPLGFASAVLAVGVLFMKFGPDFLFGTFGTGPLNILAQRVYGLLTDYVADLDTPVHLHGKPPGTLGHRQRDVFLAQRLALADPRRHRHRHLDHGGDHGGDVRHHRRRGGSSGPDRAAADAAAWLQPEPGDRGDLRQRVAWNDDPAVDRADHLRADHRNLDQGAVHRRVPARLHAGQLLHNLHHHPHPDEPGAGAAAAR